MVWRGEQTVSSRRFVCGHCGSDIASEKGFTSDTTGEIRICHHCGRPTHFQSGKQVPGVAPGKPVDNLPADIASLYDEARNCVAANSHTAAVLACRKLLMHIGVEKGADERKQFIYYVEYLADQGYVPPDGKGWVDRIREKGNEANHEINIMPREDAVELITFLEMLLRFIYEFPAKVPPPASP